jgi:hypothetical protein
MEKVEGMAAKPVEDKTRFPMKVKLPPSGPDGLVLNLQAKGKANKNIDILMSASSDSRDLEIKFSGKQGSEGPSEHGLSTKTASGEPVSRYVTQFGVYREERTYEFETPQKEITLMVKRSDTGDVTIWIRGQDLSKAKAEKDPKRDYLTRYMDGEKTVGYMIEDFLELVNLEFYTVRFHLQA